MATPAKPLNLQPASAVFSNNYSEDQKAYMRLWNDSDKPVAYRIESKRPGFYGFKEPEGILEAGQSKELEILLKRGFPWDRNEVARQKLSALLLNPNDDDVRNQKPVKDIFLPGTRPREVEIPLVFQPPPGNM